MSLCVHGVYRLIRVGDEKEQITSNQAAGAPADLRQIQGDQVVNGGSIQETEKTYSWW